jgi:hypothetical protein
VAFSFSAANFARKDLDRLGAEQFQVEGAS